MIAPCVVALPTDHARGGRLHHREGIRAGEEGEPAAHRARQDRRQDLLSSISDVPASASFVARILHGTV